MTPEEINLIDAALALRDARRRGQGILAEGNRLAGLLTAADALIYACPWCNAGGHTCPGDGNAIPHGATDCGNHDETRPYCPRCTGLHDPAEHDEPALIWVERTWADVRLGDRVRMIGSDNPPAIVQTCVHLHWHADPRSSEYRPEALEWAGVRVSLQHPNGEIGGPYEMDPAKPIEIEIAENEIHLLNALGWENRVGVIRDDIA